MEPNPSYRHYNINGLLTLDSNFDFNILDYFFSKSIKSKNPDIILNLSKTGMPDISGVKFTQIAPGLEYSEEKDLVVSTVNLLGLKAKLSMRKLLDGPTEVYVDQRYRLLSKTLLKMPISTAFPYHAFIQMIIQLKLLITGHTFLIGGCFEPSNNSALIISSMGGMGKTSTVFETLKKMGGRYLSDDMVIIDKNGQVYSYPKPIRIRKLSIPPMSLETYVPPTQILDRKNRIKKASNIKTICLLEHKGRNEIKPIDHKEALRKILLITRKLLPYYTERTILAYSYMNKSFTLYNLMKTESDIISQFIEHADCYSLSSGSLESTVDLIRSLTNEYP